MISKYKFEICYYVGRSLEMLMIVGCSTIFYEFVYPAIMNHYKISPIDFGNSSDIELYFNNNMNHLKRRDAVIQILFGWISQHILPPMNWDNLQYIALMFLFNDIRIFLLIMPREYFIVSFIQV